EQCVTQLEAHGRERPEDNGTPHDAIRRFALAPPPSSGPCSVLLSGAQVELSSKEQRLMVETKRKGRDDKKVMT
ncbi:hypothetical protein KUCAC02_030430, partial [Chaenocephalus aceratus]